MSQTRRRQPIQRQLERTETDGRHNDNERLWNCLVRSLAVAHVPALHFRWTASAIGLSPDGIAGIRRCGRNVRFVPIGDIAR